MVCDGLTNSILESDVTNCTLASAVAFASTVILIDIGGCGVGRSSKPVGKALDLAAFLER